MEVGSNLGAMFAEAIRESEIVRILRGVAKTLAEAEICAGEVCKGVHTAYVRITGVPLSQIGVIVLMTMMNHSWHRMSSS